MTRNTFVKAFLGVGSILIVPLAVTAKSFRGRINKGIKVDAGKDRFEESISLHEGDTFFCKVSTKDTNGDIYIFESTRGKKGGPPLHYHFEQDEWWYILEGEFLFKVGDQTFTAKAGDSVFGPRLVPHAFAKVNEGPSKLLMAFQPAGKMEEHFKAVSKGVYTKMTKEERDKFQQGNGFKVVGPALTYDNTIQQ